MLIGLNHLQGNMPLPSLTRCVGTQQSQDFDSGSLEDGLGGAARRRKEISWQP